MQITPTQPQPIAAYQATVRNSAQTMGDNAANSGVATQVPQNEASQVSSGNVDNIKTLVAKLMAKSDVRPEVVVGRSANDPAKSPTDDQLRAFIEGLSRQE